MEQLKYYMATLILLICVLVPQFQAHSFRYCEDPDDYDVKVKALDISTYPVILCKPFTLSISATAGKAIREGKMIVDMELYGVHVQQRIHDLCSETSCPVSSGRDFVISFNETLPQAVQTGSYILTANLYNENNSRLACIKFDFIITTGSSVAAT